MPVSVPCRFIPTFGQPVKYFGEYPEPDLVAALGRALQPDQPLLQKTFAAMGIKATGAIEALELEFINYGQLQIIFRIGVIAENRNFQFAAAFTRYPANITAARREFSILQDLHARHPDLIIPAFAYEEGVTAEGRAYAVTTSRYMPLARCIAIKIDRGGWGIYNPEPYYRFESFPAGARDVDDLPLAEACRRLIIATLVKLYDDVHERGIAATRTSGGDFILTRDYQYHRPGDLRRCWRVIAARDWAQLDFPAYLNLIRREFSRGVRLEDEPVVNGDLIINHKSVEPFTPMTIDAGIDLGLRWRQKSIWKSTR